MSLKDLMKRLAAFEPTESPVISLYLNAQPDTTGRNNYDLFVRQQLQERAKTFRGAHTGWRVRAGSALSCAIE